MKLKTYILIVFLGTISHSSYCQSIDSLFLLLPADCTPELNQREKKILLETKEYIIPGGDSIETVKYEINETKPDYLNFDYSFTTGQRGFISFEIRKFKKTDGTILLIYSRISGTPANFTETNLSIFDVQKRELVKTTGIILPDSLGFNEFFKHETPDSIKQKLSEYYSASYNLSHTESQSIEYTIFTQSDFGKNWVIGESREFVWDGKNFIKGKLIKQ